LSVNLTVLISDKTPKFKDKSKKYINIFILEDMVRHKLGEFSETRILKRHKSQQKDQKQQKMSKGKGK